MTNLIKGELLKLWTTRMLLLLVVLSCVLADLQVIGLIVAGGRANASFALAPRNFAGFGASAYIFTAALGALCIGNEGRHHTADHTYLATPRRSRVIVAKVGATVLASMGLGVITEATIFAVGLPLLASKGVHLSFDGATWLAVAGQIVAVGIVGAIGLGVGGILRNQVAAIISIVAWLFVAEGVLTLLVRGFGRYGVRGLLLSIAGVQSAMPRWAGFSILACYVLVLVGICTFLVEQRDVA